MNRWLSALLFCIVLVPATAQQNIFTHLTSYEKRGDKMVYYFSYLSAVENYLQALKVDPEKVHLQLKIAECYRMLNDPKNSEKWYALAMAQPNLLQPEHRLHYAMALNSNGKFEDAKKWYQRYQAEAATDSRSERKIKMLEGLDKLFKDSVSYKIELTNLNSKEADFSPSYYKTGIVFVSNRIQNHAVKSVFSWNKSQFLDLYFTPESENGSYSNPTLFDSNVNSRLHEGPTTYYANGTKMMFTRNNLLDGKQGKSKEGVIKLKLYSSEQINGEWSKPVSLPFNNNEYSVGHPAISADGGTLYFISDKPGGKGGTDIYKATQTNGQWGEAVNLGDAVNTEGNEMFPYLHPANVLYFSSNGHGGLGGFDVFRFDLSSNEMDNQGAPFNSTKDDFGLIVSRDGHSGFFSSNREGGQGDDDIYHFQEKLELVELIAYDSETGKVLEKVSVTLQEGSRNAGQYFTDAAGSAITALNPHKNYHAGFALTNYKPAVLEIENKMLLQPEPVVLRVPLIKLTDDEELLPPSTTPDTLKTVLRLDDDGRVTENNHTDEVGVGVGDVQKASVTLIRLVNISGGVQDLLVDRDKAFLFLPETGSMIDASGVAYAPKLKLSADSAARKDQLFAELSKAGISVNFYEIKNIYYDFNQWNIRNDASTNLDKVVHLLLDYSSVNVVLSSHTDSRSTIQYNNRLSGKRADAAEQYLINEGVDAHRISKTHFGETKLVNTCGDNVVCDETDHEANRRTEFTIQLKKQ